MQINSSKSVTLKYEDMSPLYTLWCRVAMPREDIHDPSAVFKLCPAAGSILVLYWSSPMLYMLVWANERAALESARALNLFPACTVTVEQSATSPMVSWVFENFLPIHFHHYWERVLVV